MRVRAQALGVGCMTERPGWVTTLIPHNTCPMALSQPSIPPHQAPQLRLQRGWNSGSAGVSRWPRSCGWRQLIHINFHFAVGDFRTLGIQGPTPDPTESEKRVRDIISHLPSNTKTYSFFQGLVSGVSGPAPRPPVQPRDPDHSCPA